MNKSKKIVKCCISFFIFTQITIAEAQSLPSFREGESQYKPIVISAFIDEINTSNTNLRIKKLSSQSAVSASQQAGKVMLSPLITYARGSMYTQAPYAGYTNPSSNTIGAMVTVEGWGKRSAREAQAIAESNRINAEMIADTKSLETEAIFTYIDALRTKLLWQSYQEAILDLSQYQSPAAKHNIAEFQATQKTLANDLKYFSYSLVNYLGNSANELPLPMGTLNLDPKNFIVADLIAQANSQRVDIISTQASIDSASANLEFIKANKNIDVSPGVYYTETPSYSSGGIGYGNQKTFTFLVSVPLSNQLFNDSDMLSAVNTRTQQEIMLQATKTKIITEINQTYLQYQSARERLDAANKAYILAKQQKSGGITGLLAFREIQVELFDARTVHAKTLILLERLSGNFAIPNLN